MRCDLTVRAGRISRGYSGGGVSTPAKRMSCANVLRATRQRPIAEDGLTNLVDQQDLITVGHDVEDDGCTYVGKKLDFFRVDHNSVSGVPVLRSTHRRRKPGACFDIRQRLTVFAAEASERCTDVGLGPSRRPAGALPVAM